MCGICGIVAPGTEDSTVTRMRDAMLHRGPDDAGAFVDPVAGVALGHRRLSIIDLSPRGRQPLANEDDTLRVIVNGEFYGFASTRERLIASGHVMASDSDSEIALHLYEEMGERFLGELRGMFALALWDGPRRRLLLARDRVGKKPLFYAQAPGRFAFASEIKALRELPWVDTAPDPLALDDFLALGYVTGDRTIHSGIRKLPPATLGVLDAATGTFTTAPYWRLPEPESVPTVSEDDALETLQQLLDESVRLRLVSDVPVGVFLSGGVDSSLVAATAARMSGEPLRTFTIGFDESTHDESPYARAVAEHIGSVHHEIRVTLDMMGALERLPALFDEPFADSSAIPTLAVSQATREHVTVALAGDGGDELFAGYNWYEWVLRSANARRRLGPLGGALGTGASLLPAGTRGRHFLRTMAYKPAACLAERTFFFGRQDRDDLIAPALRAMLPHRRAEERLAEALCGPGSLLDGMQRYDFGVYLPDDILTKVDRASMGVSLEVRAPLLDQRIVEFAFALPDQVRYGGVKKRLLKQLAARVLPAGFPLERKHGFSLPLGAWLAGSFGDVAVERILAAEGLSAWVDTSVAPRLLARHRSGKAQETQRLWALLVLAVWFEASR